jgi:hypothetical protein
VIASQNQSRALLERRVYDPTMDAVVGNVTVNKRPEISPEACRDRRGVVKSRLPRNETRFSDLEPSCVILWA